MKVARIAAVVAAGLVVANTAANLTIKKARNSAGLKEDVVRDAVRAVVTPAVVTYRRSETAAAA